MQLWKASAGRRCFPVSLPGAFFSSVSEEKKQKKTAFVLQPACKKETAAYRQSLSVQITLPHMRFSGGSGRGLFPGKSLLPPIPQRPVPAATPAGAFFSSVSEEKKQKKTAFVLQPACKKETAAYRQSLPVHNTLSHMRFSGGSGRELFPGKSLLPPIPPRPVYAATPAGGLLFFCVRRKEAKEDRICIQVGTQKETTANRQSLSVHNTLPHMRFSGGSGRGLFPGKSLLPPIPQRPVPAATPAGGLLFFCVRRKEAKEDRICFAASMQKRDCRLPAVPFCA